MNNSWDRDDYVNNRLFLYRIFLNWGLCIIDLTYLNQDVIRVETNEGDFLAKKYRNNHISLKNYELISFLKKSQGFPTPGIYGYYEDDYAQSTWIIYEWLEGATHLSFKEKKDRQDALLILEKLHTQTKDYTESFSAYLAPSYIRKWQKRAQLFAQYKPQIEAMVGKDIVQLWEGWAEEAVRCIAQREVEPVKFEMYSMIHGDLAAHNFVRTNDKRVYLIDFDCGGIGPSWYDYSQIMNRMLIWMDWSVEELEKHLVLQKHLRNPLVVANLIFPSDCYREWTTWIQLDGDVKDIRREYLEQHMIKTINKRELFIQEIKNMIEW